MARFALALGVIAALLIAITFRRRITRDDDIERVRQDDVVSRLGVRLTSALLTCGIIAYVLRPEWMVWGTGTPFLPALWVGVVVGAVSFGLMVWSIHSLGDQWSTAVGTARDHRLVTNGPYRWIRHPLYVAFGMLVLAIALISQSWLLTLLGVVVCIGLVYRATLEEQHLQDRFGNRYRDYARRTGRFVPRRARRNHGSPKSKAASS